MLRNIVVLTRFSIVEFLIQQRGSDDSPFLRKRGSTKRDQQNKEGSGVVRAPSRSVIQRRKSFGLTNLSETYAKPAQLSSFEIFPLFPR